MRMTDRSERMYLKVQKKKKEMSSGLSREKRVKAQTVTLEADRADLLPHGDVDDDEEQQGERRDPAADDERHGWEQCLVHDLQREDKTKTCLLVMITNTHTGSHAENKPEKRITHTNTHTHTVKNIEPLDVSYLGKQTAS